MLIITQGHAEVLKVTIFVVQQVQVIKDMVNLKKKKKNKIMIYVVQDILRGLSFIHIHFNQFKLNHYCADTLN